MEIMFGEYEQGNKIRGKAELCKRKMNMFKFQ